MANIISNNQSETKQFLLLSNGATSVLIAVLVLAGSRLAITKPEVEMIIWLATRDQNILGLGMVGFDLNELPWSRSKEIYESQKAVLAKTIDRVKTKKDFKLLDYDPPYVLGYIETFEKMLNDFRFEYLDKDEVDWLLKPDTFGLKCQKHGVLKHSRGCVLCNDEFP